MTFLEKNIYFSAICHLEEAMQNDVCLETVTETQKSTFLIIRVVFNFMATITRSHLKIASLKNDFIKKISIIKFHARSAHSWPHANCVYQIL